MNFNYYNQNKPYITAIVQKLELSLFNSIRNNQNRLSPVKVTMYNLRERATVSVCLKKMIRMSA